MGRLAAIVAEHSRGSADPVLVAREREAAKHRARLRSARERTILRKHAMRAAAPIIGRVIFPARWDVVQPIGGSRQIARADVIWEGLRLEYERWPEGSARLTVYAPKRPDEDRQRFAVVESAKDLAATLRGWKLG